MLTDSHHVNQICSCTSCYYDSRSCNPSVQRVLREGSKIDRLFLGKYIPLRERNLLKKLARTRAVYDDISCQLMAESSTCIDEKYFAPRKQPCCDEMDFHNNPDLMDTCGTAYEYSSIISRHGHGGHSTGRICRSVRFTTKPIKSEPYTSTSKTSGLFMRRSKKIRRKLRPNHQKSDHSTEYTELHTKRRYKQGKKYNKLKKSKSRLMQSQGKWALRTEEAIKEHKKTGESKNNTNEKKTDTGHTQAVKRSTNTHDLNETSFSIRKDSVAKFKDEMERRRRIYLIKLASKYKPCKSLTPGCCLPGECDPKECCRIAENRSRKRLSRGRRGWHEHPHHNMRHDRQRNQTVETLDQSQKVGSQTNVTDVKSDASSTSKSIREDKSTSSTKTFIQHKVGDAIPIRENFSDESDKKNHKNNSSHTKLKKRKKKLTLKLKAKGSRTKTIITSKVSNKEKVGSKTIATQISNKNLDEGKKKSRLKRSYVGDSTETSKYKIAKHKLRRCFCSLRLTNQSSGEIGYLLPQVDYGPYECDTEVCDPSICFKFSNRLRMRHPARHMKRLSTEYRRTKSTSSFTVTTKSNKPKKIQSSDFPTRKIKKKRTPRKVTATSSSPGRQRSKYFKVELESQSSGSLRKSKPKERGLQSKIKQRKQSTSTLLKRKHRGSYIVPKPKDCLCELRRTGSRDNIKTSKSTKTENLVFAPYDRSKLQSTSSFADKSPVKSKGTLAPSTMKHRKKDSNRKAKSKKLLSPIVDLKIPRQTVRYGSNISFTIEFRKYTDKVKGNPHKNRNIKQTEIYTVDTEKKSWPTENLKRTQNKLSYHENVGNRSLIYDKTQPNLLYCTLDLKKCKKDVLHLPNTMKSNCESKIYLPERCSSCSQKCSINEWCPKVSTLCLERKPNYTKMKINKREREHDAITLIKNTPFQHYNETMRVGSRISISVEFHKQRATSTGETLLLKPTKMPGNRVYLREKTLRKRNKTAPSGNPQGIKLSKKLECTSLAHRSQHKKCLSNLIKSQQCRVVTYNKYTQSMKKSKLENDTSPHCNLTQNDMRKRKCVYSCNAPQMKQKSLMQKCFCWLKVQDPLNEHFKVVEAVTETESYNLINKNISKNFHKEIYCTLIDISKKSVSVVCIPNQRDKLLRSTKSRLNAKLSFAEKHESKPRNVQKSNLFEVVSMPSDLNSLLKKV